MKEQEEALLELSSTRTSETELSEATFSTATFKLQQADGRGHPSAIESMKASPTSLDQIVAATNSAILVRGTLEGRNIDMLVDTGSAVTILRGDVWNEVSSLRDLSLEQPGRPVVAANGEYLRLIGETILTIEVGGLCAPQKVLVAENMTQECLLGADFLKKYSCVVDLGNQMLLAGGKSIPFLEGETTHELGSCHVSISETTVIPGQCQAVLSATLLKGSYRGGSVGVIEPELKFIERHGLLVARSLSSASCENDGVWIQVLNPSPAPITVREKEKVGTFQPVEDPDVVFVTEVSDRPKEADGARKVEVINTLMADVDNLSSSELHQLNTLLNDYVDVISLYEGDLGRTDLVQHSIDTQGAAPVKQPPRRLPFHRRGEVKQLLDKMLEQGIIEPAQGPWSSPIVLVPKKDGSTRFCVDFRKVNSLTRKDAHPLPRIDESLDALSGAQWFTTIDLASGYWQVDMKPEDREKTSFATAYGLFQFRVMPFGLCNAPSTFQRLMETVLTTLHWTTCLVYLDDIIIFSKTVEEHLSRLKEVFERLRQAGLKLKPSKCCLLRKYVHFLGHIVSAKGLEVDPKKTECVSKWPTPRNPKELKQFLGLASYYRRFVLNFAHTARPLYRLTEKGRQWSWTTECEEAFCGLKAKLTSAPILVYPRFDLPFIIDCDASNNGLGAILSQKTENGEYVVSYASRTLTKAERSYSATRKEMLALVWAVRTFRPYLYGKKFKARTDHHSLKWLQSFREPEGQVARWLEILAEYDFEVEHRPGYRHGNADALSRKQAHEDESTTLCNATTLSYVPRWSSTEIRSHQRSDPISKSLQIGWKE